MKWLALLALFFCAACKGRTGPVEYVPPVSPPTEPVPLLEPGPSIYELPIELVDEGGTRLELGFARGKAVLVAMFYASCSIACPLLLSEVHQVLDELPNDARDDVHVLFVSFDAARDTPAKLAALASERKLDSRWTLAAANDADARALAAVLGVKYRRLANGEFAHGSTIVALDGEGREIARTDSLGQRTSLVQALSQR